jgi:WD40 repeat protein/serine/threonine protein kinase
MDNKSKKADGVYQKGQLIGHYQIVAPLAQTPFARRYLGQQLHHRTPAVIEVLRPPLIDELRENFLTQARTLMKLEYPHILRLWDAGIENYYPFLVSDHESYLTLRHVHPRGSKLSLTRVVPHLKQLASALDYAHDQQILHGDIRPENILLDKNNNILVCGFTIQAIIQNRERLDYQRAEMIHEVIAYTAPERIQGKANPASDQYSVAIVVYELLCGETPFNKGSHIEIAHQQLHTPPPSLLHKIPGIPMSIEKVVMKALAKDPSQRFTTIQEFISALEQEQNARGRAATVYSAPPAQPTGVIAAPVMLQPAQAAVLSSNPPSPTSMPLPAPLFSPVSLALQDPITPMHLSLPIPLMQAMEDSVPLPRRRDNDTVTRRAFAVGLVGLATLGGTGGWYLLQKRLARPAAPIIALDVVSPATPMSVNQKSALIFTGHLAAVNALAWSPDGKLLASASDDTFVQIFDANSGRRTVIYSGHTEEVAAVGWSPDGKLIASGGQDQTVQVWASTSGAKILTYKGHTDRVNAVSWSSDSRLIASGGEDKTVQVWSAVNGELAFNFLGHTAGVLCAGWQPNNSSLASGSWDGTLRDWATVQHGDHFTAGEQIFSYGGHGKNEVYALAWSPHGSFIASAGADQTVQISNGDDGTPRLPFFTDHQSKTHVNPVRSVAWSPDGNLIASGDTDGNVYVWKTAGRKTIFIYRGHKGAVNALAWSPDGKTIASASSDSTVHVWQPS